MKKVELLSPAGDMETLKIAINNGCDAVYVGGVSYGARKYAKNFSNDELIEAIKYCHLYGVKIYVTINTIIYDNEIEDFINYVKFLHSNGVDAVIMQDIGMIKLVKEILPNLEIHSSTQCHSYNDECLKFFEKIGVKRVVLARELSLEEINKMDTDIEKEVFIHGALCVSFSGQCYFSSLNGGRSGNRGECVGCCRLPYQLLQNNENILTQGDYLLSMKDLNTTSIINKLLSSNIASLKIEGRMKSPAYVGYVTNLYRSLIDNYYNNIENKIDDNINNNLSVLFNRDFTTGYLDNQHGSNIINIDSSNHKGIIIGDVIEVNDKKIKIKLNLELNQNDGIRFDKTNLGMMINYLYDKKDNLINHADQNDIIYLDNKIGLKENNIKVIKTIDSKLVKNILNSDSKRVNIDIFVLAILNNKLTITITDGDNKVTVIGNKIESSKKIPTTTNDIEKCMLKLGNTMFNCNNIDINVDKNIFIPLSELNNLRREAIDKLINLRENKKKDIIIKEEIYQNKENELTNYILVLTRNEEQLKYLIDKVDIIVTDDINLYNKYKDNKKIYYRTSRVTKNNIDFSDENIVISDIGALNKYGSNNNIISSIYLNVNNSKSVNLLINNNVKLVNISVELYYNNLVSLINNYKEKYNSIPNLGVLVYGRVELMITKYCLSNMIINKDNKKCSLCKNNVYKLKADENIYPIVHNNCINYILDCKNIDNISRINDYKDLGINNFIISLYDEDNMQIGKILNKIRSISL